MGLSDIFGGIASALGFGVTPTTRPAIAQPIFQQIRAQAVARANLRPDPRVQAPAAAFQGCTTARGNGFFVTETIVQTIELATGQIIRSKCLAGSPFLMNNEVNKLRTVARKLGKANARLPRKTRRASAQRELVDAVTQNALRRVITDGNCPS